MALEPKPLPESRPFWDGARNRELVIQACADCQSWYFPPAPVCPKCSSRNVNWKSASGRATLYSYVIAASGWPQWRIDGPMSVAIVTLEEGPRLLSTIVDCEQSRDALQIDMPLEVTWRAFGDNDAPLLCFRPRDARVPKA